MSIKKSIYIKRTARLAGECRVLMLVLCFLFSAFLPVFAQEQQEDQEEVIRMLSSRDPLLSGYTLDELQRYRNYYMREITRLENERRDLRLRGIRDGELFLLRNPKSKEGDKIMMRLAELLYEQTQEDFENQMREFDRLYSLYDRGELLEQPKEPVKDIAQVLNMYISVIEDYPASDLVDDAFYNIGYLLEESGHPDSAFAYYDKILLEFPESSLKPDVYMRIGEFYFNPPENQLEKAISYYEKVVDFRDSPRYDEALYRLGWSYYRLSDYAKAISYFTLLADDIDRTKPYDPLQRFSNPSLADESVEYIGLSFLEYGGPGGAANYIQEIGGRNYGGDVLKRIGDAYFNEKEDYTNAIVTYNTLLRLYPDSPIAPSIQNKIVTCYRRLENQPMAYLARDLLFNTYKQNSDWWNKNTDEKVREEAMVYAESALRDNISVLLSRGKETDEKDLFRQSIVESRKYLAAFPQDSSAALIHWNMALTFDTKLDQKAEAFEEYIRISNIYWDSKYQRFAAENAVAVAREGALKAIEEARQREEEKTPVTISDLKKEAGDKAGAAFNFREKMKLQPTPLTPEEQKLATAYDNFIRLFPHAQKTPVFLANAGSLHYTHHQFKEALRYFNTLLKHFSGSEEYNQARYAIMESYFGKADFSSAEIVARRIVYGDASDEIKSKARRRLAESIYLNAEGLAEGNLHLEAGDEYRRVVQEAPRSDFADLALFNAGLEYDKAGEFMRAIDTYNYLLASHPSSGYVYDAQNNLAFDYVELKDYKNAALTYQSLAAIHPEEDKARDALFNSSFYFAKAKEWESAIKINTIFLQRFPKDEVADDLAFEVAGFQYKLGRVDESQQAYQKFIDSYPNSPLVVEAFFRRGQHLHQTSRNTGAIVEYQKALSRSKLFKDRGIEGNEYFAAEAELAIANIKIGEFEEIQLRLPESQLNQNKERKKDLLLEIVRHLGNCASYGTYRVYEATCLVGYVYQEFARSWAAQDIPQMEDNRYIVAQKEVNDAATLLYDRAGESYRNGIASLRRLAEAYKEQLLKEALQDSADKTADDTLRVVQQDSVLRIADHWIDRSKRRLSEVNYAIGEISLKSARAVMDAPIPKGLGDFPTLVYRKQVLDIAVDPLLNETLDAFRRNLVEADSFQIESQWIELSKQKFIDSKNIIPQQYTHLSISGLNRLKKEFASYSDLIHSGNEFESILDDLQADSDDILNSIEFCALTINSAKDRYVETIHVATELGIEEQYVVSSKDSLMISLLSFALKCDTLSIDAKKRADLARSEFIKTDSPLFEEGLFTFESNYFSLRKLEREMLVAGYDIGRDLNIQNIYYQNLALQLVRFDPEKYAGLLDLEIETTTFTMDSTWKASPLYYEGWITPGFDASAWKSVMAVQGQTPGDRYWFYMVTEPAPVVDSTDIDAAVFQPEYKPANHVFFRKSFSVSGLPVGCSVNIDAKQPFNLYFNGDLIHKGNQGENPAKDDTFSLSELLIKGANLIGLDVVERDRQFEGIRLSVEIKSLPDWDARVEALKPELTSQEAQEKPSIEDDRTP